MFEKIGLWIIAALFVYGSSSALWNAEFRYRNGPLIRRRERPIEYWVVTSIFAAATLIVLLIALLRSFDLLPPGGK
jgi:hypothetical protein